ncbi:MAG: hypothetical protein PHT12_05585 [Patescibacteria group bacterium]|nr:hypothetical protein [Patescibacteria group bacterium]
MAFLSGAAVVAVVLPLPPVFWLAAAYFLAIGTLIGRRLFPEEKRLWPTFLGLTVFSSAVAGIGGLVYHLYRLDWSGCALTLFLAPLPFVFLRPAHREPWSFFRARAEDEPALTPRRLLHVIVGIALAVIAIMFVARAAGMLAGASTDTALRTPWDVVPADFFLIFCLASLAALSVALADAVGVWALAPLTALSGLAVSVAVVVYRIGYGFDPFIHQATERLILTVGEVAPKPLYYAGQYALVTVLTRLGHVAVADIDAWLVPIAFAAIVPLAYWSLRRSFRWPSWLAASVAFGLLLLPLDQFVSTTPQGLANVFALATLFVALPMATGRADAASPAALVTLVVATLITHPLAGIPLAVTVGLVFLLAHGENKTLRHRLILAGIATAVGALALPAALLVNGAGIGGLAGALGEGLRQASESIALKDFFAADIVSRQYQATLDFAYAWRQARVAAWLLAGFAGAVWLARRHPAALAYLAAAAIGLTDWFLIRWLVRFPSLIDYEQSAYADRLIGLSVIMIAPAALWLAGETLAKLRERPALKFGAVLLAAGLATASLYLAYPRHDQYETSRGWSTSGADVKAVQFIEQDAAGRPYVTLANQSVSAAAMREFGFKRYYDSHDAARPGQIYFYPIPTGGALYAEFLDMNDALGSTSVARRAMDLAGTDTTYFVVSNYWWQAQKIISAAKRQADYWWKIDDDYVFKYTRGGRANKK